MSISKPPIWFGGNILPTCAWYGHCDVLILDISFLKYNSVEAARVEPA